jgi:hypothetical protein
MRKVDRLTLDEAAIAQRIHDGLKKCIGKQKAATCKFILKKLQQEGYKTSEVKIRALIHYLRTHEGAFICGDQNGFYMPATPEDRTHQINSLNSRIREITEVRDAMVKIDLESRKQTQLNL